MQWEKTWVPICEVCQCFWTHRDAPFWSDGRHEPHRPRCPGSYFFNSLPAYDPHPLVTPFCQASSITCTFVQRTTSQVIGWPWLLPIRVHLEEYRGDLRLQNLPLPTETPTLGCVVAWMSISSWRDLPKSSKGRCAIWGDVYFICDYAPY